MVRESGLTDSEIASLNPLVRSRILAEHKNRDWVPKLLRAAQMFDWETFSTLVHYFFVDLSQRPIDALPEWYATIAQDERENSAAYKGVFASALLTGLWQHSNFELQETMIARFMDRGLLPLQPYGALTAWDRFSERRYARYAEKNKPGLTAIYSRLRSLVEGCRPAFPRHLDLGCGSGFPAEVFRGMAGHTTRVDQSQGFLEFGRLLFDRPVRSDLTDYLRSTTETFDLITLGGVVQYFYRVDELLGLIRRAMNPGAVLAFNTISTKTELPICVESYISVSHGREHISQAIEAAGLRLRSSEPQGKADLYVATLGG